MALLRLTVLLMVAIFLIPPTLMAQTPAKQPAAAAGTDPKFAKLVEAFLDESLTLSPAAASQAGYHKHVDKKTGKTIELDALLDDVGPESIVAQRQFYARSRERFRTQTPLNSLGPQDAADWQLIDDQIGLGLLELDHIQSFRHNATNYVELVGGALFQPLTDEYAPKEVRLKHILSRISQIPRFLDQAKKQLLDSDPIFVKVALEENEGNIGLIQDAIAADIPAGSALRAEYDKVAPPAIEALKNFSLWLQNDLAKRPNPRSWRLGKEFYPEKFRLVMETPVTPEQVLADAEKELKSVRAEMLEIALPLHQKMYADHGDHASLSQDERENTVISEVLQKISADHPERDQLMDTVKSDLAGIRQFIIDHKIVSLQARDNLKVIPTPPFLRGIYSVAGFHSAPPLDPTAEAQYWVTPIDPKMPDDKAESKLREYNNWVLQWLTIHEALPGHYVQAEHANDVTPVTRRLTRGLFSNGAYVEGWAEYVAQVMMRSGYANNDPRYRLSYLKVWLRALANAVLDVRMHTMNMTDAEAMDLMMHYTFQTQAEADGKLQRAKLSSVQLPTYYVGTREWWRLRNKYEAAKGKDFNLTEFHDRALDEGALPLPLLEKILLPQKGQ
jgi:uncharacterized protein (DUF885 family)